MIRRDYGNAISVFEFTPTEGKYGVDYSSLGLYPGDSITITLAGQLAMTGVVTDRTVAYDKGSHQVVIAGRSKPSLARDSSIPVTQGTYDGQTMQQAASSVLQPYGVNFTIGQDGDGVDKTFDTLRVQYGEGPHEFIGRMAMMRNVQLSDDVNGNIVATRQTGAGATIITLTEGDNILRAHMRLSNQGVASGYTVASQQPGSDQNWPTRAIAATATNSSSDATGITRLLISEHPGDAQDMQMRANWELSASNGTALSCTITIVGWQDDSGSLLDVSTEKQASVYSPMLFPGSSSSTNLALQSVTFRQDSANGSTTDIELTLPTLLSKTAPYQLNEGSNGTSTPATPDSPDSPIQT